MNMLNGNKSPKSFEEQKKEWLARYDPKTPPKKMPEYLVKYKRMVSQLEDRNYLVIGYGSLLNKDDVGRTSPNLVSHRKGYISGWKRIFNMGSCTTGNFLNVEKDSSVHNMLVSILEVPAKDMPNLIMREINYQFIDCDFVFSKDQWDNPYTALMVVGDNYHNHLAHPQLNYLHLCIQGANKLDGQRGVDNFLSTTDTNFGSLRKWFTDFSMLYLMRSQDYISR